MSTKDVLTTWIEVADEDYGDYYRDTLAGRQTLTLTDAAEWELTQEGYLGILCNSIDQQVCIRYANQMASVENLRIAGKDAYDFAKSVFYQISSIIKHMCSADADQAEDGLKEIAQVEACLLILRHRLSQRTATESYASRAEAMSAEMIRLVGAFYAELLFGQLDLAGNKLVGIEDTLSEMRKELADAVGDPGNKS